MFTIIHSEDSSSQKFNIFFFHTKTGTLHFLCSGELSQMDAMHLHVLLYKSKNIFISDKLFIYYSFIWELFLRTLYCRWISIYCQDLDFMLTVILLPYIVYKGADFLFPSCQMPHKPGLNSWFWVERDWMPFIFLKCENKNTMPKLKNTFSHFTPDRHLLKNINNRFQKQIDPQWNDVVYLQIHLLKRTSHIWVWQLISIVVADTESFYHLFWTIMETENQFYVSRMYLQQTTETFILQDLNISHLKVVE